MAEFNREEKVEKIVNIVRDCNYEKLHKVLEILASRGSQEAEELLREFPQED